jgi:hypothetical protein
MYFCIITEFSCVSTDCDLISEPVFLLQISTGQWCLENYTYSESLRHTYIHCGNQDCGIGTQKLRLRLRFLDF